MPKLFAPLLAAAALIGAPLAAQAKPPVWTIHDGDSTIVLFGSVHILKAGADWKPQALTEALAKADDLWFEIPLDAAGELAASQAAVAQGMLPPNETLSGLLDPKSRALLAKVCKKLNVPVASIDRFQPWLADTTLSDLALTGEGAALDQGVEETLERETPARVQRRAFETAAGQIGMFAHASRAAQLASLKATLKSLDQDPEEFRRLVAMWLKADVKGLNRDAVQDLKKTSPELYDILIKRRNTAWVKQIEERLKGHGETVMVVGVGHLIGPDSVPAMLRAQGVKVEGP